MTEFEVKLRQHQRSSTDYGYGLTLSLLALRRKLVLVTGTCIVTMYYEPISLADHVDMSMSQRCVFRAQSRPKERTHLGRKEEQL